MLQSSASGGVERTLEETSRKETSEKRSVVPLLKMNTRHVGGEYGSFPRQ
ncbi:hypothetical protein HMPREF9004_0727 [Schaalia cardiffensis F0333]|uniref:Uncharacterized protein n=1 Tax=Schaalia cardiffensis F0333 TaxID=888050 RepID=N6XBW0_9ACTO|nr:hypothetical protein HMPREF9004_0727 [Schaalia cardiffensis F0333]